MAKRRDEWIEDESDADQPVQIDRDLVGSVYRVPDRWWNFDAVGRDEHPGACADKIAGTEKVQLLKGTDPKSARYGVSQVLVEPDQTNGLKKPTSFAIRPFPFSGRKVAQLHFDRLIGKLRQEHLQRMQAELVRLFGNQGSPAK